MGKLAGILFENFIEWIEIVEGNFLGFFGLEGSRNFRRKIWPEIRARNSPPPFGYGRAGVMEGGLT